MMRSRLVLVVWMLALAPAPLAQDVTSDPLPAEAAAVYVAAMEVAIERGHLEDDPGAVVPGYPLLDQSLALRLESSAVLVYFEPAPEGTVVRVELVAPEDAAESRRRAQAFVHAVAERVVSS